MAEPLQIRGLSKAYGDVPAVCDVSLDVAAGELFFLLGPSGCGKTTLLRMIAGFCAPDAGTIALGSADLTRLPPEQRGCGMVFQSYALWPHMTVAQNVAFGLEMRRIGRDEIRRRTRDALALVRMEDRAAAKPNELSGGQQQRVALARALVIEPRCLLLDEPLSNLDAKLRLDMRGEIRRICKEAGLTAVYVTHDQKEALSIADRLAVMEGGRVRQVGTPEALYRQPVSAFVASFIGETNLLPGTLVARDGDRVRVRCELGELRAEAPAGLEPGRSVVISLRPECLRLYPERPADAVNAFPATIHDAIYQGESAQYRLAPAGSADRLLKAAELNPRRVAAGRAVWAAVAAADVVVLPE